MMEVEEEEKKPFEGGNEEEQHPDPDEELMLDQGQGKVWLVKIPKFLMERWAAVDAEDTHLASIRIYEADPADPNPNKKHKLILFLPPNRDPANAPSNGTYHSLSGTPVNAPSPGSAPTQVHNAPSPLPSNPNGPISFIHPHITNWPYFDPETTLPTTGNDPDLYTIEMVNDVVENQIVVAERQRDRSFTTPSAPYNPRARMVILTGRIKHECNVKPAFSASYRKQMRERHRKWNTPIRTIQRIEGAGIAGGKGGINRITSGVAVGAGRAFNDLVKTKPKQAKGTYERMARMPRNQLLDQLFASFRDQPRWTIKTLREKTQQPEAYLKEVMSEIAFLHRSGEFNGLWELKANYKDDSITSEHVPVPLGSMSGGDPMDEDFDDEDDDEDDMEEVS